MELLLPIIIVLAIGLIAGLGLAVASTVMAVPSDERVDKVRDALPGANCGGCGYSGCDGYAAAVVKGECEPNLCRPGGAETAAKIGEILGVTVEPGERLAAEVKCAGGCDNTERTAEYSGIKSCAAANMLYAGALSCRYGCLGLGDCAASCEYGAITVGNGLASVDLSLCVACGKCVAACPKKLISLVPVTERYRVRCSNRDRGAVANKACKVSCIACGKCAKVCPQNAVYLDGNVAVIEPGKCAGCGECAKNCPKGVIVEAF